MGKQEGGLISGWNLRSSLTSQGSPPHPGRTHMQEGNDAISGNGLQQAGCPGQALQSSTTGGEEGADDNNPGGRPGQHTDDQVPLQGFPEPAEGAGSVQGSSQETLSCPAQCRDFRQRGSLPSVLLP